MKKSKTLKLSLLACFAFCILSLAFNTGCGVYRFNDVSIPDSIKTVRIGTIVNKAQYVNPQLTPLLTDRLKQKITNQTRLSQTNSDNADWDIQGYISDYSVSTSGVSSVNGKSQTSINRLTVTVHISIVNTNRPEIVVSRQFDFDASLSLQAAEARLLDDIVKNVSDEIFNNLFSNWN